MKQEPLTLRDWWDTFGWALPISIGLLLVPIVIIIVAVVVGERDHDNCRDRGGIPYRSICLEPGSLR